MKLIELGQLFALPLQSAIKAQSLALQETISFIEQFGLDKGKAKTFSFKAERMVEERIIDSKTGIPETKFNAQLLEVTIPILAMVSPPSMQLQEMNVEFGVEVVEPKAEPIKSTAISSGVVGSSFASSLSLFTPLSQSNPTTMKVNMKIVKETHEGIERLRDILTNLLSANPLVEKKNTVDRISGMAVETSNILNAKGIITIEDFVSTTEKEEDVKELAKTLGVSAKRIGEWREKAKLIINEGS